MCFLSVYVQLLLPERWKIMKPMSPGACLPCAWQRVQLRMLFSARPQWGSPLIVRSTGADCNSF